MPDPRSEPTAAPFQWGLLAWAALVGLLTGLAIVGFHYLLGFINSLVYGPFVAFVLDLTASPAQPPPLPLPEPPLPVSTPLRSLLQMGLGGMGLLPPPPPPPPAVPLPPPVPPTPPWLNTWPVVLGPVLGGVLVGLLRRLVPDPGPSLPSLMAMADGRLQAQPQLPLARLLGASISLGSGASLGPEGPSVESGGNIGLWIGQRAG
ncbi:MAG: chloride channel protein, partial [Cyanobacteriota bacterium]|nr:chloride channel protein [Cyanobacteriota bacterium]